MRGSRPSSTAALIAAAAVFVARDPRVSGLIPADAASASAKFLMATSSPTAALVDRVSSAPWRVLARLGERLTVPGLPLHFAVRKRHIEAAVGAGIVAGARRVVVIGAGFDTLALRLSRAFPDVEFVELDHPATQGPKRAVLPSPPANLRFLPIDLGRERLADVLGADASSASGLRTVFVLEGVLMYLPLDAVHAVFAALADVGGAGARVVFTVMEPAPGGRLAFHNATVLERWVLRLWREPFRSGLPRAAIEPFLRAHGFCATSIADAEALRASYLVPIGAAAMTLAVGELVVAADRIAAP